MLKGERSPRYCQWIEFQKPNEETGSKRSNLRPMPSGQEAPLGSTRRKDRKVSRVVESHPHGNADDDTIKHLGRVRPLAGEAAGHRCGTREDLSPAD